MKRITFLKTMATAVAASFCLPGSPTKALAGPPTIRRRVGYRGWGRHLTMVCYDDLDCKSYLKQTRFRQDTYDMLVAKEKAELEKYGRASAKLQWQVMTRGLPAYEKRPRDWMGQAGRAVR